MKSTKKSIIYKLMDEERHSFRKGFARYVAKRYGVNLNTAYPKLKQGRFHQWEVKGIEACLAAYDSLYQKNKSAMPFNGYTGELTQTLRTPEEWRKYYDSLEKKAGFIRFMNAYEMGKDTVRRRFGGFNFTEIELKGWENVYKEYLALGGMQ